MRDQPLAERIGEQLVIHPEARAVRWDLSDLVARDGHLLRIVFGARVRALGEPTERRMLTEAFLSHSTTAVTVEHVRRQFEESIRAAARRLAAEEAAEALLAASRQPVIESALVKAAQAVAFASGIEIVPPYETSISSPTLAHQRLAELQRTQAEARLQRRREVEAALAIGAPLEPLSPEAFVEHMAAAMDLAAAKAPRATLAAVSGQHLALLPLDNGVAAQLRLIPLDGDLGPLRSVRCIESERLLIGAQRGVILLDLAADAPVHLRDPDLASELGFNDAVLWRGQIWATHGDGGLVAWDPQQPAEPARIWRTDALRRQLHAPDATPRHLLPVDDQRLAFAMGPTLCTIDADGNLLARATAGAAIVCLSIHLTADGPRVLVIRADGGGELRSPHLLDAAEPWPPIAPAPVAASSACLNHSLAWCATDEGLLTARALHGGALRTIRQFTSTLRAPRRLAATPRYLAALAPDRQRIVLWQTPTSDPHLTLHLTPHTRHRIADICWVGE